MKKIKPSDLRREAEAMIRDGSMPSLETVLQAVADAREKYAEHVKATRKPGFRVKDRECVARRRVAMGLGSNED